MIVYVTCSSQSQEIYSLPIKLSSITRHGRCYEAYQVIQRDLLLLPSFTDIVIRDDIRPSI